MTTCTDDRDARDATSALTARLSELDDRVAALEAVTGLRRPAHHRVHRRAVAGLPPPRTVPDPGVVGGPVAPSEPVTGPARAALIDTRVPMVADWSRLPVWAGAVVTLGGVLMLLALAATAGWLSPPVRVSCGAVLGAALVGAGARAARRSAPGTASAALAGTGILALFCSLAAATALYPLLPVPAGLAGCLAVAAGGIALADRWRNLPLALGVLVAAELAVPLVAGGPGVLALALALVLQTAAGASALRRADRERWAVLNPLAALATAVHGLLAAVVALITSGSGDEVAVVAVAAVALALGTAVAVLGALRPPPVPPVLTLVLAPVPLLVSAAALGGGAGAAVCAAAGIGSAAVATPRVLYRGIRLGAAATAGVLLMTATALLLDGGSLTVALLVEALALLTVAATLRMRSVLTAGTGFAVPGVLMCVAVLADPSALLGPLGAAAPGRLDAVAPVGAALLVLVAAGALLAARRSGLLGPDRRPAGAWLPASATGLYGVSWLVVTGTQLVLPGTAGFLTGHVLVTVGITVLGLLLLGRGVGRSTAARVGFVLLGAALAKLVLFDLPALDGLGRVAAFIGAGVLLLAAGGRYASRVAAARAAAADDGPDPTAAVSEHAAPGRGAVRPGSAP